MSSLLNDVNKKITNEEKQDLQVEKRKKKKLNDRVNLLLYNGEERSNGKK